MASSLLILDSIIALSCALFLLCSSSQDTCFATNLAVHGDDKLVEETKTPFLLSTTASKNLVSDGVCLAQNIPGVSYLTLALQWPLSVCNTSPNPCNRQVDFKKLPRQFTIHGLWPQSNKACTRAPPTFDDFKNVITRLRANWPNVKKFNENNQGYGFWSHEYTDHGKCIGTVEEYFQKTLDFYDNKRLSTLHTRAKMAPGLGPRNTNEIQNAIKAATGVSPILKCNTDPNSNSQLWEIRFHLNTDFTFRNATGTTNCAASVRLPSAT